MSLPNYKHIECSCGGVIGMFNGDTFNCQKCDKEYKLYKLDYDWLVSNNKTGWIFPVKDRSK